MSTVHQLIFAQPKPGMSEPDFWDYWLHVHAVRYASQIPQIRRYMVCTRVDYRDCGAVPPPFSGVAEIWLRAEEQIASLQSEQFLEGARADEPKWAAFWATLALDTDAFVIEEGPPLTPSPTWIKLYRLLRRREGVPLPLFRDFALGRYAQQVRRLPGLLRYLQCHCRDGLYKIGEPRFDAVEQWWFEDTHALQNALGSAEFSSGVEPLQEFFINPAHLLTLAVSEHWIIGPEERGEIK